MRTSPLTFCLCIVLVGVVRADSLHFRQIGRWGSNQLTGVAVKGKYAYVVGLDSAIGLYVISIADPANPVKVGFCSALATPRGVVVSGEYAYFANDAAGLRVISISDPTHPVEVGRCSTRWAYSVAVSDNHAYVCDTSGLSVISIADPYHPVEVGHLNSPGGWHIWYEADVVGDYAYVAAYGGGLRVVSVADPTNPVEVGCYEPGCNTNGVALGDEYAYLGCAGSFRVVSVADPTHPVEVGRLDSTGLVHWGIALTHGYAFTAGGASGGLWAISVSDPTQPALAGYYGGGFGWNTVVADGDYLYYCGLGLRIFQFYQLGDLDVDNDSLDVVADTLRLSAGDCLRTGTGPGTEAGYALGEFVLANTSASYNPDSIDGPSVSPVDSLSFTGSLTGPGGTLDSILIPNLPESLAQGQTIVCTLAVYAPPGMRNGDYAGSVTVAGEDTAGLQVYETFYALVRYELGDLDVDDDSLDVVADTLRLQHPVPGARIAESDYALGEFILANTSASYNPDTADGPSLSRVGSLSFTGSLTGPGGTIDSILVPNLPASLAQGQSAVCTLAVCVPPGMSDGDYAGPIVISGYDSLHYEVAETVYALVRTLGDLDVDNDSLDVIADTIRLRPRLVSTGPPPEYTEYALGEFILANTDESYNPDTADGPSLSPVSSLGFTGSLAGPGGALDSVRIPNLPDSLAQGQTVVCTLAVYVPPELPDGDYSGSITILGRDSGGMLVDETFCALIRKTTLGDLDVDNDSLDVARDTMNLRTQPGSSPSGKARFMLVNTSSTYNPDAEDGPSRSPLRGIGFEAKVEAQHGSADSVRVLNLPESLAVGQAVECTLALVLPAGAMPDDYGGWVTIIATDSLGYRVQDSFAVVVSGAEPHQNLDSFRVVPTPFKPHQDPAHDAIHFQGLTEGARVIVYDASGQSVWSEAEKGDGHLKWDAKVASGIYVYLVVSKDGNSRVGKLSVIR